MLKLNSTLKNATLSCLLISGFASSSIADGYSYNRKEVVPIRFDDNLNINRCHVGDRFKADIDNDNRFPRGSHLEGYVSEVNQGYGRERPELRVVFDRLCLPWGQVVDINATAVPRDDHYVYRNRDGYYEARPQLNQATSVEIGAVGGLLIGSLVHKPIEGAIFGALVGLIAGHSSSHHQEYGIRRGSEACVYFLNDCHFDDDRNIRQVRYIPVYRQPVPVWRPYYRNDDRRNDDHRRNEDRRRDNRGDDDRRSDDRRNDDRGDRGRDRGGDNGGDHRGGNWTS